jgi:hypothetical protein
MNAIISVLSTLISSVALVGVAVSLLLQARQLRISQLQASRSLQSELIRIAIDNPTIASATASDLSPDEYPKAAFLNLALKSLEMGYSIKAFPAESVRIQMRRRFESEYSRAWWAHARDVFKEEAGTRRGREFFALVDSVYRDTIDALRHDEHGN